MHDCVTPTVMRQDPTSSAARPPPRWLCCSSLVVLLSVPRTPPFAYCAPCTVQNSNRFVPVLPTPICLVVPSAAAAAFERLTVRLGAASPLGPRTFGTSTALFGTLLFAACR